LKTKSRKVSVRQAEGPAFGGRSDLAREDAMKFRFDHNNLNVRNLEKSLEFYRQALGLVETRKYEPADKSFKLVFLGDGKTGHKLELTWLRDRVEKYNLGDNEFHLALVVDDYDAAYRRHKEMGCVCYENPTMGIYFIEDPDGYWVEILPERK
jgi:lactoylglutathione lyase